MSGGSFIVPALSRREIRKYAQQVRSIQAKFGLGGDAACFDIVGFLDVTLPRLYPEFVLEVLPYEEMGVAHGMTYPQGHRIQVREDVYLGARSGKGRDRLTLAHELGHYVLHSEVGLARATADDSIPAFSQSEWQANAFGGELLVDYRHMTGCQSHMEAALKFAVSLDAAKHQWKCFEKEGLIKTKRS